LKKKYGIKNLREEGRSPHFSKVRASFINRLAIIKLRKLALFKNVRASTWLRKLILTVSQEKKTRGSLALGRVRDRLTERTGFTERGEKLLYKEILAYCIPHPSKGISTSTLGKGITHSGGKAMYLQERVSKSHITVFKKDGEL